MYHPLKLLAVTLVCTLLSALSPPARSQHSSAHLVFPQPGQTNITVQPEIMIATDHPIDPGSVTTHYPNADGSGHIPQEPTVRVRPVGGDNMSAAIGTYVLATENVLLFRPHKLLPSTTYEITVSGLVVMNNGPVLLAPIQAQFTTRANIAKPVACSMDEAPLVGCSDTIRLSFSGDVRTMLSELSQAVHVDALQPEAPDGWVPQPFQWDLSQDNVVGIVPPGRWTPGAALRVRVDWSTVTGDMHDDRTFTTVVRQAGRITIAVEDKNGKAVADSIIDVFKRNEQAMMSGSTSNVATIDRREDFWRFVEWKGPLMVGPTGDVTLPCELLRDEIPMTAIIEQIDTVSLVITLDSGGVVDVFSRTGQLIRTITTTDTIAVTRSNVGLHLVARPDPGYTVTGWSAPSTPLHGAASAALVINNAAVGGLIGVGIGGPNRQGVTPGFSPAGGNAETYRLKGFIYDEDQDNGFDVNEGVAFTTESEFESGIRGFRTICVQASDCWEISGYSISATGTIEYFPPLKRVCVRAEMLDPQNSITFFVRRTTLMLRVERVVLETDDASSVRYNENIHPEGYVRLEKRVIRADGSYDWRLLGDLVCLDAGIFYTSHALKCGDAVRIRTKGATVRGQDWKFWDNKVKYAVPTQTSQYGDERRFELIIDEDLALFTAKDCRGAPVEVKEIRTRACFKQQFGIEAIGVSVRIVDGTDRSAARFEERWLDPLFYRLVANDEPIGGRQIEYVPWHGTELKVRFTSPLDIRTIYEGGLKASSYNNTLVSDPTLKDLDFNITSADAPNVSFEPVDGSPITTAIFRINDPETSPRMQALHAGAIDLTVLKSVRSLVGTPMIANAFFVLQHMELPGFGLQLRDVTYAYDGDPDFWFLENDGEIYHATYGANLGHDKARHADVGFSRIPDCSEQQGVTTGECTLPHSDKDGPQGYGDKLLWLEPHWMDRKDFAWWHISTWDEDCKDENDCLVNRIGDILNTLREETARHESTDRTKSVSWSTVIPGVIRLGADMIQALLPPDEQDQHLGQGTFAATAYDLWGTKTAKGSFVVLDESPTRYRLRARLFVNKSVIR
jgi:hypothetical protein